MMKVTTQQPLSVRSVRTAPMANGRFKAVDARPAATTGRPLNERTPLYMGLITISSALAAVTQLWAGVVTFGLMVLVYEGLHRWFFRWSR